MPVCIYCILAVKYKATQRRQCLVESRFIRYMVGSIDAVLTNAYILQLVRQDQAAEGDNEIRGHLKNLVSPLFLPTLLVLVNSLVKLPNLIYTHCGTTKPISTNSLKTLQKWKQVPILENPLNKRLRLHQPSIEKGVFTPNTRKPNQQVNILQHDIHFQPQVRGRGQPLTPDVIMGTVEERFTRLTSAILRKASAFLALSEQEQHIVNMFDVRSFDFQDPESLREQYNEEFLLFASHLNKGSLLFLRKPCGEVCVGIDCPCLLGQYVTFKERVRDNKDRFKDVWLTKNAADQTVWNTTNVLSYFQKTEYSLHDGIPDVVEIIEMCLVMSRSQSDT